MACMGAAEVKKYKTVTNCAAQDEMPSNATSDLGLHIQEPNYFKNVFQVRFNSEKNNKSKKTKGYQ